jgi:anti-sigma B factor antagonist
VSAAVHLACPWSETIHSDRWGTGSRLASSKERTRIPRPDNNATEHPAVPGFEIRPVRVGEDLFLLVSGELDLGSADKLEEAIREAEKATAQTIVVDLTNLRFMDARGLNVLLRAHTRSRQDGQRLRFIPSKYEVVRRLVAVPGASRMFD